MSNDTDMASLVEYGYNYDDNTTTTRVHIVRHEAERRASGQARVESHRLGLREAGCHGEVLRQGFRQTEERG